MEIWAFCRPCRRWFYVGADPNAHADCPACGFGPAAYENRATASGHPELLEVREPPRNPTIMRAGVASHERLH